MDTSLLFFYAMISSFLIYFAFKIKGDTYKWQSLSLIFSLILNCFIASSFFKPLSGLWWLSLITGSILVLFFLFMATEFIQRHRCGKYIQKIIAALKTASPEEIARLLISHHDKRQWYVLNAPSMNAREIGVNIFNASPVIGKKFFFRTLTGRNMAITPEYLPDSLDFDINFICALPEFYNVDAHTKTMVENYLARIKTGEEEPWRVLQR